MAVHERARRPSRSGCPRRPGSRATRDPAVGLPAAVRGSRVRRDRRQRDRDRGDDRGDGGQHDVGHGRAVARGRARRSPRRRARHRRAAGGLHDRDDLFRTIVEETRRALRVDHVTIRVLKDERSVVAAWAGLDRHRAARPADRRRSTAGSAQVAADRPGGDRRQRPRRPAPPPRPGHRRADGGERRAARLDDGDVAFITTLATHAAIALTNAELFEQTEARAAQLGVLQAASGRLSRAVDRRGRRPRRSSRRPAGSSTTTTPGSTSSRPDEVVPIAFEGTRRRLRAGRPRPAALPARGGVHGLGRPARRAAPRQRRQRTIRAARRSPGPTTSTSRCSSCRCATTASTIGVITLSKLGLDGSTPTTCGC